MVLKKVPTNTITHKKEDGKTLWPQFVKKNISLLKERWTDEYFNTIHMDESQIKQVYMSYY